MADEGTALETGAANTGTAAETAGDTAATTTETNANGNNLAKTSAPARTQAASQRSKPELASGAATPSVPQGSGTEGYENKDKDADPAAEHETDINDQPITDWSAVDLGLPEDAAIDESVLAAFGEKAVELGLTPKQAKALTEWQLALARDSHEAQIEAGTAELRKAWGKKVEANQQAVVALISRIDRQLGNEEFSKAIGTSGAANSPAFCKGLLAIAQMLSEDTMGRGGSGNMPQKPETALEGIENAFKEMRARN